MQCAVCYPTMNDQADLIFVGGRVHTVNATNDVVSALAVEGGRILAAGGDAAIRGLAGPRARVVELRGRWLLPGFIDGHCHVVGLGMAAASIDCKAPGMQSIEALQGAVKQRAANFPVLDLPRLVKAVTSNVEVGKGDGTRFDAKAILDYALFAYQLPAGHVFQSKIDIGCYQGYNELTVAQSCVQSAVGSFCPRWLKRALL